MSERRNGRSEIAADDVMEPVRIIWEVYLYGHIFAVVQSRTSPSELSGPEMQVSLFVIPGDRAILLGNSLR